MSTPTQKTDAIQGEIVHEYDGILEADNALPTWWLAALFGTILFGFGYWGWFEAFHVTPSSEEIYAATMAARAAGGGEPTAEILAAVTGDPTTIHEGAATFASQCSVCHGARGEGVIGPNLTDGAWLHGDEPLDIYRTIRDGVAARGMPTWGPVLGPRGVLAATAFVVSLRNTNVPGRAPEGAAEGSESASAGAPAE